MDHLLRRIQTRIDKIGTLKTPQFVQRLSFRKIRGLKSKCTGRMQETWNQKKGREAG
jgi:hypothetical protein